MNITMNIININYEGNYDYLDSCTRCPKLELRKYHMVGNYIVL